MPKRWGLGPVFVYESLLNARRWQVYAGRSLYVAMLLIGMAIVWVNATAWVSPNQRTFRLMAMVGKSFFYALTGTQLAIVMLAAPAAAAGSICMDRARGTLLHMMVTDLFDSEIVLGKLASRLSPVVGLIVCGVPVTALAALLGGIDFHALFGAFVVTLALAAVGCSLAIAISVWAKKTHEVLLAVFMIEVIYLLALPIWWLFYQNSDLVRPPDWFQKTNPFVLVFAPYNKPGFVEAIDYVIYVLGAMTVAASLTALSIAMLRRAVVTQSGRAERSARRIKRRRFLPSMPGPTLDRNPVLWREWHRSRPSRPAMILWVALFSVAWILAAWDTYWILSIGPTHPRIALPFSFLFQWIFGLLMVSALAPTVLAEERVRASLDVVLATPIPTRSIVVGKWWGVYRWVLILAVLPLYCVSFLAATTPSVLHDMITARLVSPRIPLSLGDRIASALICPADFLASGAVIVSLGLLISTWVRGLGRGVSLSVSVFLVGGIGWIFLVESFFPILFPFTSFPERERMQSLKGAVTAFSPIFAPMQILQQLLGPSWYSRSYLWTALSVVVLIKFAIAGGLFLLTVKTFDRCLGRMSESTRRVVRKPIAIHEQPAAGLA